MMATAAELAKIKKLEAKIKKQEQEIAATMAKISPTISAVDPAQGLKLAEMAKKNADPGSPAYTAAVRAVTQAENTLSGVTQQRDELREKIAAGPIAPTNTFVAPVNTGTNNDSLAAATRYAADQATAIDYENFKNRVAKTRGYDFASALNKVWVAMLETAQETFQNSTNKTN